ncbi:exported hypothetical protein [Xenorhabdus bovienii str. Intermedium]|uniref:Inner membrane protein n=1 Tax=Xenorhabdus bovienii str. Intermedium TaxID=1379677 RepID=A0A077QDF0_XENBV|nr:exported hypothetical protein [Xenorhabdus bovienii str. Intermedium]
MSIQKNKVTKLNIRIRLLIIFSLGVGFVIYGATHFSSEKEVTRIPRILYPLYENFGSAGLGSALIVAGLFIIFYAIFTYKKIK